MGMEAITTPLENPHVTPQYLLESLTRPARAAAGVTLHSQEARKPYRHPCPDTLPSKDGTGGLCFL